MSNNTKSKYSREELMDMERDQLFGVAEECGVLGDLSAEPSREQLVDAILTLPTV